MSYKSQYEPTEKMDETLIKMYWFWKIYQREKRVIFLKAISKLPWAHLYDRGMIEKHDYYFKRAKSRVFTITPKGYSYLLQKFFLIK